MNIKVLGLKEQNLLKSMFDTFFKDINSICNDGRELSIVKTKLEEAYFFAAKCFDEKML